MRLFTSPSVCCQRWTTVRAPLLFDVRSFTEQRPRDGIRDPGKEQDSVTRMRTARFLLDACPASPRCILLNKTSKVYLINKPHICTRTRYRWCTALCKQIFYC
ncbi:hypothetical protein J6590_083626 [Homalodisca vitripennis]|nr:hypothetical protein J6590_083626 [Homalodisca vitripennis]